MPTAERRAAAAKKKAFAERPKADAKTTMELVAERAQESYRTAVDNKANIGDLAVRKLGS